ncbi:MAG: inorganic phosphate transporter [Acidobacteria bacterium]|nr:inorganic phosphate transporter [Acidobacteriota bacterium]
MGHGRTRQPRALHITADHLHWLSSGAVSFARGLNDTPKIVALALSAVVLGSGSAAMNAPQLFVLVTAGMVVGSLVAGRRVTQVLAEDVTPMDHREGLAANLVTAMLVTTGAIFGLPMSTTHVSSGGIVSVGAQRGSLNERTAREIGMAWVVTVPAAALLGAGVYALARVPRPGEVKTRLVAELGRAGAAALAEAFFSIRGPPCRGLAGPGLCWRLPT